MFGEREKGSKREIEDKEKRMSEKERREEK